MILDATNDGMTERRLLIGPITPDDQFVREHSRRSLAQADERGKWTNNG